METIKDEELDLIKAWVRQNTGSSMYPRYLEEYWFHQKDELRKLLNGKNIYEEPIEFEASSSELNELLLETLPQEFIDMLQLKFRKIERHLEIQPLFDKIFGDRIIYLEYIADGTEETYLHFLRSARRYFTNIFTEDEKWQFVNNSLAYSTTKTFDAGFWYGSVGSDMIKKLKVAITPDIFNEISWRYMLTQFFSRLCSKSLICDAIVSKSSKKLFYHGDTQYKFYNPYTDKVLKIQNTDKPLKMIKNIFKLYKGAFSADEWAKINEQIEEVELIVSRVLNTSKIKGTLCLSIHPMDFMTLSDNANRWTSCMSWGDEGCYRAGTLEMLSSSNVIVAYLKSDKVWHPCYGEDYLWASKKWRELFVITPFMIAGIKGYPYHSSPTEVATIKAIAELAEKNWGIEYDLEYIIREDCSETDEFYKCKARFIDEETGSEIFKDHFPYFECNEMYNDTSGNNITVCYKKNLGYNSFPNMVYYGECAYCINCGTELENDFEGNTLSCYSCRNTEICEECGCLIENDDTYWVDGHTYCRDCIDLYFQYDDVAGEYIDKNDAIKFSFLRTDMFGDPYKVNYTTNINTLATYDIELVDFDVVSSDGGCTGYCDMLDTKEERVVDFLLSNRLIRRADILYTNYEITE